ncbi:MAG TPA: hypothetical protein VN088_16560 [Nocardioides sp.]|nr:hypothetical protein [Nocardioides sp.]
MVELFPDFKELHGSSPADITAAAAEPHASGQALVGLSQSLISDAQRVHGNTEGDIQTISTGPQHGAQVSGALGKVGMVAAACLKKFGTDATTFDTGVHELNHQISTSGLKDPSQPDAISASTLTIQQNVKNSLRPKYQQLVTQLDSDAEDTSRLLAHPEDLKTVRTLIIDGFLPLSAAGSWPGINLTAAERTQAEQNEFKLLTPEQQVAYVKAHPQLDFDIVPVISPAAAQKLADEVAGDVQSKKITDQTARILSALATSSVFANRFYGQVTPDQMGDAIEDLNRQMFGVGNERTNSSGMVEMSRKPDIDLYNRFMNGAGLTLATYSRSCGDPSGLADTWYHAITDDSHPANAAALTLLIREGGEQKNGTFDPTFIDRVTQQTYDWERSHHGDPVWGPKAQEAGVWIRDPDKVAVTQTVDEYGQTVYSIRGGFATDGLANLLGGMGHSPEGAQRFFSDDSGHVDNAKMDYLIGGGDQRTWDGADMSDDGDGLGEALQAACVGQDQRTPVGTEIADKLFQNIAKYGGQADGTFTHEWHVGPEMTDSLGTIAAGYSGDLYDMLSNTPPAAGSTHLHIQPGELTDVLREIGGSSSHQGLETLTTAMLMETRNRDVEMLTNLQGPHTIDHLATSGYLGLQEKNADVMGNLLHYGTDMWDGDDKSDAARAAILSKAVGIAGSFVPGAGSVLGEGATDLAKTTYDVVKGQALDQISQAVGKTDPATAAQYVTNVTNNLPNQMLNNAVSDLYRTGYLGHQHSDNGDYQGVSPDLFTGNPPTLRPELTDGDGYSLDTTKMTQAQKNELIDAWRDLKTSPIWNSVYEQTYTGSFYDRINHPTPLDMPK